MFSYTQQKLQSVHRYLQLFLCFLFPALRKLRQDDRNLFAESVFACKCLVVCSVMGLFATLVAGGTAVRVEKFLDPVVLFCIVCAISWVLVGLYLFYTGISHQKDE